MYIRVEEYYKCGSCGSTLNIEKITNIRTGRTVIRCSACKHEKVLEEGKINVFAQKKEGYIRYDAPNNSKEKIF